MRYSRRCAPMSRKPESARSLQRSRGPSARNLKRWILPVAVFGSSLRNSIQRGYLNGASFALTCSCSARTSASLALSGDLSTTKAFGLISFCSSFQPTTAASSTSGCDGQRGLDLERRDIHARHFQHVVGAAAADVIAVGILDIFVARARPFALEGRARLLAVVPVHDRAGRPARIHLAHLALLHRLAVLADQLDLVARHRLAGGAVLGRARHDWSDKMCSISVVPRPSEISTP